MITNERGEVGLEKSENISPFNYENKIWGSHKVNLSPKCLGALRLKYALDDLSVIKGRVLEIGCGGGSMAKAVKAYRRDLDVYACDISHRALQMSQNESELVNFSFGDAYNLPFHEEEFDAVLMFDILEHLQQPNKALSEAVRVLSRNGIIHISVPCEGNLITLQGLLRLMGWRAFERTVGHIQAFNLKELNSLLVYQGLRILQIRWSGHFLSQIAHCAYVAWLALPMTNLDTSVEAYLENSRGTFSSIFMVFLKNVIAMGSYFESKVLRSFQGASVHLAGFKE